MGEGKKNPYKRLLRNMNEAEGQRVRVYVVRADDLPPVLIDGRVNPIHGDWLWDLFEVPPVERTEVMHIEIRQGALRLRR